MAERQAARPARPARLVLPTCTICDDEDSRHRHVATACGHTYHETCLLEWDAAKRNQAQVPDCPVCHWPLRRLIPDLRHANQPATFYIPLYSLEELPPDPELARLIAANEGLNADRARLQASFDLERAARLEEVEAAEESHVQVAMQWSSAQEETRAAKEQCSEIQYRLEVQTHELAQKRAALREGISQVETLRQSCFRKDGLYRELVKNLELKLEQLTSTNESLEKSEALGIEREKKKQVEVALLQGSRNQLETELKLLQSKNESLANSCKEQEKDHEAATQKLKDLQAQLDLELNQSKLIIEERDTLRKQNADAVESQRDVQTQLDLELGKSELALRERDALHKEDQKKEASIKSLQEAKAQLEHQLELMRSKNEGVGQRDTLDQEEDIDDPTAIEELKESQAQLEVDLNELRLVNERLEEQLALFKEEENKQVDAIMKRVEKHNAQLLLDLKNWSSIEGSESSKNNNSQAKVEVDRLVNAKQESADRHQEDPRTSPEIEVMNPQRNSQLASTSTALTTPDIPRSSTSSIRKRKRALGIKAEQDDTKPHEASPSPPALSPISTSSSIKKRRVVSSA